MKRSREEFCCVLPRSIACSPKFFSAVCYRREDLISHFLVHCVLSTMMMILVILGIWSVADLLELGIFHVCSNGDITMISCRFAVGVGMNSSYSTAAGEGFVGIATGAVCLCIHLDGNLTPSKTRLASKWNQMTSVCADDIVWLCM